MDLAQLEAFYGKTPVSAGASADDDETEEPSGSNGMAIAPSNTADHHALLLINPHTSFFFRSELQMASDEGLDAYGAVTWGQFFVYQGFNDQSGVDAHVERSERHYAGISKRWRRKAANFFISMGTEERPVDAKEITVPYKTADGMAEKKFTVYRTHHGPIIGSRTGNG